MKGSELTGPGAPLKGGFFHNTLGWEEKKGKPHTRKSQKGRKISPTKGKMKQEMPPLCPLLVAEVGPFTKLQWH